MLSEIKQIATEKFCHYVGQSTCSAISDYGAARPIALAAIAAIGVAAATIIFWNWNATVLNKPEQVIAPQNKVQEYFPELTAKKLEITSMYFEKSLTPVLGPNPLWATTQAPYLDGDLRLCDGSKIPLKEGDYLIKLEINHCNAGKSSRQKYYYLPALLVRRLHPEIPFTIQYKNELKTLTISEKFYEVLKDALRKYERNYYAHPGALSNDPVEVIPDKTNFFGGKRYLEPTK